MEEKPSPKELVQAYIRKNLLFVGLIGLGIVLVGIGGVEYVSSNDQDQVQFITADSEVKGESIASEILVDVAGAVEKPGVYRLKSGSRLQDALIAAGGLSKDADRAYVSQKMNQAQIIEDASKIYIPTVEEVENLASSGSNELIVEDVWDDQEVQRSDLIDINTASENELDTLPKVGPATAQKIIASRPYGSIEELVSKKVLGQKTFEGLKDKIETN